jgi:hypothetical protein
VYKYFFTKDNKAKLDYKTCALIKDACKTAPALTEAGLAQLLSAKRSAPRPKPFSINRSRLKKIAQVLPDDSELENLFFSFLKERFGMEA